MGFCSSFVISSIMNCREVFVSSSFHISQPPQARFVVTSVTLQCIEQHCWVDGRQFQWGRKRKTFFLIKIRPLYCFLSNTSGRLLFRVVLQDNGRWYRSKVGGAEGRGMAISCSSSTSSGILTYP